jgi:hypothetical protein
LLEPVGLVDVSENNANNNKEQDICKNTGKNGKIVMDYSDNQGWKCGQKS